MYRYSKLLAPSTDTSFIVRSYCASQFPERHLPNFPAAAYLLTRRQ